jgi:hypothetical protein
MPPGSLSAPKTRYPFITNRLLPIMEHIPYYMTEGQTRLARDCQVYASTINRLCSGENQPSYHLADTITRALEWRSGYPLDMRDIFSTCENRYRITCVCDLIGCPGCHAPDSYNEDDDTMKPEHKKQKPGDWCRFLPLKS